VIFPESETTNNNSTSRRSKSFYRAVSGGVMAKWSVDHLPRESETPAKSTAYVKSGARAFELIEFFDAVRRPSRAVEIADALHIPRSSADQLLKTLVASGYLTFSGRQKTYYPSFRLARFGRWVADVYCGSDLLWDLLYELRDKTSQSAALTAQNDCA